MTQIRVATATSFAACRTMRGQPWPDTAPQKYRDDLTRQRAAPKRCCRLVAHDDNEAMDGFAKATLCVDHINGCSETPAAFAEGVYFRPAQRRHGVAQAPFVTIERWAEARGCVEIAPDALLANVASQRFQQAVSFAPTERVILSR